MKSAFDWKQYYAEERRSLGNDSLRKLLRDAPQVSLPKNAALIFPHTTLAGAGTMIAAVANAIVASGCKEVLALGVLHGARREDKALVDAARAGDAAALKRLRRVHGPGVANDEGFWREEFSLDSFEALLKVAAKDAGRAAPKVHQRYPFLVGDNPADLPGLDELRELRRRGCALVATTDPIHHGIGYDTPADKIWRSDAERMARTHVETALALLSRGAYAEFRVHAGAVKSDFRDPGPVLAELLGKGFSWRIHEVKVVDYAPILTAPDPTWVAAALIEATAV